MKKYILLVLLSLGCSLTILAQSKMTVKSFRLLENDHDALVGYKRTDPGSGRNAAIIKIQTSETGFTFSNGAAGIVGDVVYKPGEVWVYVPMGTSKLTIGHPRFGILRDYELPVAIDPAKVYEMILDLGIGRFMNISSSEPGATICLDNDTIGTSPVPQRYVLYGHHRLTAKLGYYEGELELDVTETTAENCVIEMKNVQDQYHRVTLRAESGVQIIRDGKVIASGTWEGTLREGPYKFTTHKENYEDAETFINVEKSNNQTYTLNKPRPVTGYIKLTVTPVRATVTTTSNQTLNHRSLIEMPIGRHHLTFKASGYYEQKDVLFDVKAHKTIEKEIKLEPIDYVKPTSFYVGGGFTYASLSGASLTAGMTLFNVDVQLTYTIGVKATEDLSWYEQANNSFYSRMNYKMNMFGARLGYQIRVSNRLAITPQLGYVSQFLSGKNVEGSGTLGDGASTSCFTVGAKLVIIPAHHFGIYLMPEFGVKASEKEAFTAIADKASISTGGLMATAGLFLNF